MARKSKAENFRHSEFADYETELAKAEFRQEIGMIILARMAERGLRRKDLAKLLNVTPARITAMLSGDANLTIDTVAEALSALDLRPELVATERTTGRYWSRLEKQIRSALPSRKQATTALSMEQSNWHWARPERTSGPQHLVDKLAQQIQGAIPWSAEPRSGTHG